MLGTSEPGRRVWRARSLGEIAMPLPIGTVLRVRRVDAQTEEKGADVSADDLQRMWLPERPAEEGDAIVTWTATGPEPSVVRLQR